MISDKDKQSGISDFNSIFPQNHMPAALSHPISRENHVCGGTGCRHRRISPSSTSRNGERLIAVLKSPLIGRWAGFPVIQLMVPVDWAIRPPGEELSLARNADLHLHKRPFHPGPPRAGWLRDNQDFFAGLKHTTQAGGISPNPALLRTRSRA